MNIFIDTNTFLSFYHYTSDELEELKKLAVLLRGGDVKLFTPQQVIDEFNRNRESKIAYAMKRLREQKLTPQFPQICKDYEEYKALQKAQKEYEASHKAIVSKITKDSEACLIN